MEKKLKTKSCSTPKIASVDENKVEPNKFKKNKKNQK